MMMVMLMVSHYQCDQIGRFIALWATFLSLWQQFLPKFLTFLDHFCKGIKIFDFSNELLFGATFIDIWRLFPGHAGHYFNLVRLTPYGLLERCIIKVFPLWGRRRSQCTLYSKDPRLNPTEVSSFMLYNCLKRRK